MNKWVIGLLVGLGVIALALSLAQHTKPPASEQRRLVSQFYQQYFEMKLAQGLPTKEQLESLKTFLSPSLMRELQRARIAEDFYIKTTPEGDKPDVIEGDIFTDMYEGALTITPVYDYPFFNDWIVEIEGQIGQYKDENDKGKPVIWHDSVWLVRQDDGGWRIDNVAYLSGSNLKANLQEFDKSYEDAQDKMSAKPSQPPR